MRVEARFCFGWRNVTDGFEQAFVVEPVNPFERGELDCLEAAPWSPFADHLCLVETVDGFGDSKSATCGPLIPNRLLDKAMKRVRGCADESVI